MGIWTPPRRHAAVLNRARIDACRRLLRWIFLNRDMLEVCREAERAGASSLWFAQHMGYREAMVWAAAAASVTQRAILVPTAISPYL